MYTFSNPHSCLACFFSCGQKQLFGINLCVSLFSFSSGCMLRHMHACVCVICFRAYSCSLIFALYPSSWVILFEVLKKLPVILSVTLLNFKSTFRNLLLGHSFRIHILPLTKALWFISLILLFSRETQLRSAKQPCCWKRCWFSGNSNANAG